MLLRVATLNGSSEFDESIINSIWKTIYIYCTFFVYIVHIIFKLQLNTFVRHAGLNFALWQNNMKLWRVQSRSVKYLTSNNPQHVAPESCLPLFNMFNVYHVVNRQRQLCSFKVPRPIYVGLARPMFINNMLWRTLWGNRLLSRTILLFFLKGATSRRCSEIVYVFRMMVSFIIIIFYSQTEFIKENKRTPYMGP